MNAGAFMVVIFVAKYSGNDNPQISDFDGLAEKSPSLALLLLLSTLSLAGIPPLVGFTGKWILFSAAMDKGHWFLVLWAVLNSVVSLFYYLALVKHAYLAKPKSPGAFSMNTAASLACLILIVALICLGIFPNSVITFAQRSII
jgi:NADH-quinone oxidoreductase subunit N